MNADIPLLCRVLISYSHDSMEHSERVLVLADRLRADGIDCTIDQYESAPPEGWPRWMEKQIESADFVLLVCTETYRCRFENKEKPGAGLGVRWEGAIVTQDLYEQEGENEKFIPIVLAPEDAHHRPKVVRPFTFYDVSADAGYEDLYRRLTGQPLTPKPPLGSVRTLPPRERGHNPPADVVEPQTPVDPAPSVPSPPDIFVGRQDEVEAVCQLLQQRRLVAVTGLGGVGKTALAQTVARESACHFIGGVAWVNCETKPPLSDILLTAAVALAGGGVRQLPHDEQRRRLEEALRIRPCLLIVDNYESIAEDGDTLRWLRSVPTPSSVLITSRQSVPGARVSPLSELPPEDAMEMFNERARDAGWRGEDDAAVKPLCELVGYLPLAIELLAPRAAELPLSVLVEQVPHNLDASIEACFRLSFDRLSQEARDLLTRLAVLPDGASKYVIPGFTGIPVWELSIGECVRQSLLSLDRQERYRFHPLVRAFALEQLGNAREEWQRRFVAFFCELAETHGGHFMHQLDSDRIKVLDAEWPNAIAAADVAQEIKERSAITTLSECLNAFLLLRGLWPERERLCQRALAAARELSKPAFEANLLYDLHFVYDRQGLWREAEEVTNQSLTIYRKLGDVRGQAETYNNLGNIYRNGVLYQHQKQWDAAEKAFEESLAIWRRVHDPIHEGQTLYNQWC